MGVAGISVVEGCPVKESHFLKSKTLMVPLAALLCLTCMVLAPPAVAEPSVPKFDVVGRSKAALSVVVPQYTTAEQLKTLIFQFRAARRNNSLSKMIPATTRGGKFGDYAIVWIFVFTERDWASSGKLRRFITSSAKSATDRQYDRVFVRHIKAEYFYSSSEEYGNLGYSDGAVRSPNYQKLF